MAASALLAACGGGSDAGTVTPSASGGGTTSAGGTVTPVTAASPATPTTPAAPVSNEQAARFLLQAQFSASDADIAAVRGQGYAGWLTQQFGAPASITGFDWLNSRGYDAVNNTTRYYDNGYPGDYMIWHQLMTSSDAERKRIALALALSEFFVVSLSGLDFFLAAMAQPLGETRWLARPSAIFVCF